MGKYKALMLDLDGTTIPNKIDGMPSIRVTEAISKANKILNVVIVTARPRNWTAHIVDYLNLHSPYIADNGAQIIDPKSNVVLWEKPIENKDIEIVIQVAKRNRCQLTYSDGDSKLLTKGNRLPSKIYNIFFGSISKKQSEKIFEELHHVSTLSIQTTPPWSGDIPPIIITHAEATKQHGIFEVAKLLNIKKQEIIGVGDGYNDYPLLMASGLKIAMSNAVDELKKIADYIAPSVDKDGVAEIIEKYILKR